MSAKSTVTVQGKDYQVFLGKVPAGLGSLGSLFAVAAAAAAGDGASIELPEGFLDGLPVVDCGCCERGCSSCARLKMSNRKQQAAKLKAQRQRLREKLEARQEEWSEEEDEEDEDGSELAEDDVDIDAAAAAIEAAGGPTAASKAAKNKKKKQKQKMKKLQGSLPSSSPAPSASPLSSSPSTGPQPSPLLAPSTAQPSGRHASAPRGPVLSAFGQSTGPNQQQQQGAVGGGQPAGSGRAMTQQRPTIVAPTPLTLSQPSADGQPGGGESSGEEDLASLKTVEVDALCSSCTHSDAAALRARWNRQRARAKRKAQQSTPYQHSNSGDIHTNPASSASLLPTHAPCSTTGSVGPSPGVTPTAASSRRPRARSPHAPGLQRSIPIAPEALQRQSATPSAQHSAQMPNAQPPSLPPTPGHVYQTPGGLVAGGVVGGGANTASASMNAAWQQLMAANPPATQAPHAHTAPQQPAQQPQQQTQPVQPQPKRRRSPHARPFYLSLPVATNSAGQTPTSQTPATHTPANSPPPVTAVPQAPASAAQSAGGLAGGVKTQPIVLTETANYVAPKAKAKAAAPKANTAKAAAPKAASAPKAPAAQKTAEPAYVGSVWGLEKHEAQEAGSKLARQDSSSSSDWSDSSDSDWGFDHPPTIKTTTPLPPAPAVPSAPASCVSFATSSSTALTAATTLAKLPFSNHPAAATTTMPSATILPGAMATNFPRPVTPTVLPGAAAPAPTVVASKPAVQWPSAIKTGMPVGGAGAVRGGQEHAKAPGGVKKTAGEVAQRRYYGGGEGSDSDENACMVCFTGSREYAFVSCGHVCVCAGCAGQWRVKAGYRPNDGSAVVGCIVCRKVGRLAWVNKAQ